MTELNMPLPAAIDRHRVGILRHLAEEYSENRLTSEEFIGLVNRVEAAFSALQAHVREMG